MNDARVSDHHAIIPTEQAPDYKKFSGEERTLYDLIARRFVTVLYPPCLFEQITLITRVNGESFFTRGKTIQDPGWRAVTPKVAGDDTKDKEDMPQQILKQQTQPPPNLPLHKVEGWSQLASNCRSQKHQAG